jgi:hypothetical protein
MRQSRNAAMLRMIPMLATLCLLTPLAQAKYSGGTGEPNNPYQIATAADLIALGNEPNDYDKHFILTADIDLDPNLPGRKVFGRAVIAPDVNDAAGDFQGTPFNGVLDGQGHTIADLVVDSDSEYAGLFGLIDDSGIVRRVRLAGGSVRGAARLPMPRCGTGSLAGENRGLIEDCHANVAVNGIEAVGGLVGENRGTILTSTSAGSVTGKYRCVGGLVGYNHHGTISTSRSTGSVAGTNDVGGLVGLSSRFESTGFNLATVSYGATVSLSTSTGSVTGGFGVGGLVGSNDSMISTSCSTSSVNGTSGVGGLTGYNNGEISVSISTGSVTGEDYVGGLAGYSTGTTISHSASAGLVMGRGPYVGGLVGRNGSGAISDCVWDLTASGQATGIGPLGATHALQDMVPIGLTTAQMQDVRTFLNMGWDLMGERGNGTCEFWQMPAEGGYPVLSVFNGYTPPLPQGQGTASDPYLIRTAEDLGTISYRPLASYQLAEDVNLSAIKWITAVIPTFCGRFDGQGHHIEGMAISGVSHLGLFGLLAEDSIVQNLALEDVEVTGTGKCVGGMVGYNYSGTISNCQCGGSVRGTVNVGGLLGENHGAILASSSTTSVNGDTCVGGLVGYSQGTISNGSAAGSANGNGPVGGLAGCNDGDVNGCYSTARVDGITDVGGLLGRNNGRATDCHSRTDVTSSAENVGGLVGNNSGAVSQCDSTGTVIGEVGVAGEGAMYNKVGGLIGNNTGAVTCCYNGGALNCDRLGGGLIGTNSGTIALSYNTGAVTGDGGTRNEVGGLVANNTGTVTHCYNTGALNCESLGGGLVGTNSGTIMQCYNNGAISGTSSLGGLIASNDGRVIQSYSTGTVTGTQYDGVGALVSEKRGTIVQCYSTGAVSINGVQDKLMVPSQTGFIAYAAPACWLWNADATRNPMPRTPDQMRNMRTYQEAGWDFVDGNDGTSDVWQMVEGVDYPVLSFFQGRTPPVLPGKGTADDPYLISNAAELGAVAHYSPSASYKLVASIDLSGMCWSKNVLPWFAGTFEGNGQTISHLTLQGLDYVGLFGRVDSKGVVKDLGLVDANAVGIDYNAGIYIPGREPYSTATVAERVGALAGLNKGTVTGCYSSGTISSHGYVGGLIGENAGSVVSCHSTSVVSGVYYAGGLIGRSTGPLSRCYSESTVDAVSGIGGGLVGESDGPVDRCYSLGSVHGNSYVGGLIGYSTRTVNECFSHASVDGLANVGGLMGYNFLYGSVTRCYSEGPVCSNLPQDATTDRCGGLIGFNNGSVSECYSTGSVGGTNRIGGLVGDDYDSGTVNSVWDTSTSGLLQSDGGIGKTTTEMQTAATFIALGWDFVGDTKSGAADTWWIDEGKDYPRLWWEGRD